MTQGGADPDEEQHHSHARNDFLGFRSRPDSARLSGMDATPDFEAPVRRLLSLTANVSHAQLDDATPCEGRTVRQLLGHLAGLTAAFRAAAD